MLLTEYKTVLKELCEFFTREGNSTTEAYDHSLNVLSHIDKAIYKSMHISLSSKRR